MRCTRTSTRSQQALDQAAADDSVRAVITTGATAFSAPAAT